MIFRWQWDEADPKRGYNQTPRDLRNPDTPRTNLCDIGVKSYVKTKKILTIFTRKLDIYKLVGSIASFYRL